MANNIDVKDAAAATVTMKTTDNAGVHTAHHNVDSSALPTGAATETTLASALTSLQTIDNIVSGSGVNVSQIGGSAARTGDLDTGAGTDTYPIIGLAVGADGGGVPVTDAAPLPVYLPFETTVIIETANNALAVYGNAVEDSVASSGQSLFGSGFVRDDALTTLTPVDGDWTQGRVDSTGALWTRVTSIGSALPAGTNNIGDVDILSVPAPLNVTGGGTEASALRVTIASNSTGLLSIDDNGGSVTVDNNGTFAVQAGQAAHDSAIAGNPVRIGGRAATADFTAVTTGDQVDLLSTILGKQVVKLDAIPDNTWAYAAAAGGLVTTSEVTAKAAGAAGVRNYVKSAQIINSHASISTEVVIRDGTAGTVLWRGWAQAGGGGSTQIFDPPLRGSTATLISIGEITATASTGVLVNLQGYQGAE